jgi:hypothetical protein
MCENGPSYTIFREPARSRSVVYKNIYLKTARNGNKHSGHILGMCPDTTATTYMHGSRYGRYERSHHSVTQNWRIGACLQFEVT